MPRVRMLCPSCQGRKYHFLLVDGDMLHEAVKIPCERCKGIDLGAWANESFRVPEETPPDQENFGDPKLQ